MNITGIIHKLVGVVNPRFDFCCLIDILRYDGLKFGHSIQCNTTNNIMMKSFEDIQN